MNRFKESLEWARTIGSLRGNIEYLQEVAAHQVHAARGRERESRRKLERSSRPKGVGRDRKYGRILCRVRQNGQKRTKVFSLRRYKTMDAAEAQAAEFAQANGLPIEITDGTPMLSVGS